MRDAEVKYYDNRWEQESTASAPPNRGRVALVVGKVREALRGIPEAAVIDIGCGNGWILEQLDAELGPSVALFGVEPSEVGVGMARQKVPRATVLTGTLDSVQLPRRFEVAVCSEVLEHVGEPRRFVDALAEALVDGGTLVVTTPNGRYRDTYFDRPGKRRTPQPLENWLGREQLIGLFSPSFDVAHHSTFDMSHYYAIHPGLGRVRRFVIRPRGGWRIWRMLVDLPLARLFGLGLYHLAVFRKRAP